MPLTRSTLVLALDPGTTDTAWVLYDYALGRPLSFGKEPNAYVLERVKQQVGLPLAVEMIASYGMPVGKEVFETCLWIGRFIQAHGGQHDKVYRKDVKLAICHSPKANDASIRQGLIDLIGPPGKKKAPGPTYGITADIWAALGVAVTWAQQHRTGDEQHGRT